MAEGHERSRCDCMVVVLRGRLMFEVDRRLPHEGGHKGGYFVVGRGCGGCKGEEDERSKSWLVVEHVAVGLLDLEAIHQDQLRQLNL